MASFNRTASVLIKNQFLLLKIRWLKKSPAKKVNFRTTMESAKVETYSFARNTVLQMESVWHAKNNTN
jgi:hypothetical protein